MNKLLNIILSGLLWRQYKFLIVSLLLLILSIFVAGKVHDDYLAYAQSTQEETHVGISFMIKWGVWVLAIALFLFANHLVNSRKEKQKAQSGSNKSLRNILKFKRNKPSNLDKEVLKNAGKDNKSKPSTEGESADPFAQIRSKEKLRSFADLVIERHDKPK